MESVQNLGERWKARYEAGYFEPDGGLKLEFVRRDEVEPLAVAMKDARPPLTRHQVRRFFQHCRWIERQLRTGQRPWEQLQPEIYKLDVAAADALGKEESKIPELFHDFIRWNVAAVRERRDFLDGFIRHFEALIGFGQRHFRERLGN